MFAWAVCLLSTWTGLAEDLHPKALMWETVLHMLLYSLLESMQRMFSFPLMRKNGMGRQSAWLVSKWSERRKIVLMGLGPGGILVLMQPLMDERDADQAN